MSKDRGETWTNVLNVPEWTVTIDTNNSTTVYATARTQGVFRSSDGGHTWQGINTGLTSLTMGRSAPVIIDPTNPRTLYVGSEGVGGVFKSLDGGDHWFAVNSGLGELSVSGLAMDPWNPAMLYACGPNGVYKTVTGGEVQSLSIPLIVTGLQFDRMNAASGSSYLVNLSGSNLTSQTFFDVRFVSPGSNESAVVLNWQKGLAARHLLVLLQACGPSTACVHIQLKQITPAISSQFRQR